MRPSIFSQFAKSAFVTAAIFAASPAMALIHGEVSAGQRSGEFKESGSKGETLSSQTIEIAALLDPIPLLPVGVGLRLISDAHDAKVADHGFKSMTSTAVVPEVSVWSPVSFLGLTPFGRVGYTVASAYKATVERQISGSTASGSVVLKSTGPRLAVGAHYSLFSQIISIDLTAAVEHSTETLSFSEGKVGGVDLTQGAKDISYTNTAILVGVKAGI